MIRQWKELLLANGPQWGVPTGGEWNYLFHNNFHGPHSNINVLWFRNQSQFPLVVTKVYRKPEIPAREFDNLRRIHSLAPKWAPKPLYYGTIGHFYALWMEGVPGDRFWDESPAALAPLVDMVASLHTAVRKDCATPDATRLLRVVERPLENINAYGSSSAVRDGCARLRQRASCQWLRTQPFIPQHGDMFLDNILQHKNNWYVIDWESYGTTDIPFYDLITLLLSRLRITGETPSEWSPALRSHVPSLVARYAKRLGVSTDDVRILLPLTLANWFHLQLSDGRHRFAARMYALIQHYFENTSEWEAVFIRV